MSLWCLLGLGSLIGRSTSGLPLAYFVGKTKPIILHLVNLIVPQTFYVLCFLALVQTKLLGRVAQIVWTNQTPEIRALANERAGNWAAADMGHF